MPGVRIMNYVSTGGGGAASSLAVTVATSTPTYNGTVLITATVTGLVPTSYTFILPDEERGFQKVTQAGNTYLWTVTSVGTDTIEVIATDGSSTVGGTASVTVTDPLDYLTRINHWRADTGVTTVSDLADVWADQGTAGINLSAATGSRRTYYDTQRKMLGIQSGQILDNAAGGYAGKSALTFFFITQKMAAVATNARLIEMGAGQVGIAAIGVAGSYDILFGFNNFTSYISFNAGLIAGQCVIVTYDGSLGANRSVAYANGVALAPVATVGSGGPASVGAGVGIRAFVSNAGSFPYTGTCAVIGVMDGVLTPTQVAALNARLKQIHI